MTRERTRDDECAYLSEFWVGVCELSGRSSGVILLLLNRTRKEENKIECGAVGKLRWPHRMPEAVRV
jgi:hypothetical protein